MFFVKTMSGAGTAVRYKTFVGDLVRLYLEGGNTVVLTI